MPTSLFRARLDSALVAFGGWPRRIAALLCLGLAGASLLGDARHRETSTTTVVVAAHDLASGVVLGTSDVRTLRWPSGTAPPAAIRDSATIVGRPIGAAMSTGEPITAARMLDVGIVSALLPGQVAMTLTLPDQGQSSILHAGAMIDLYRAPPTDGLSEAAAGSAGAAAPGSSPASAGSPIATDVRLLAVLPMSERASSDGVSIEVGVDQATASRLAGQLSGLFLATLRPPR
jgi:Flp pilus assembly protein CpaB